MRGRVLSQQSLQALMRYNDWQHDPLAHGSPANQIAARGDPIVPVSAAWHGGAIDAKISSVDSVAAGTVVAVSGPTSTQQPVFAWATSGFEHLVPHAGQPERFDFEWQTYRVQRVGL